MSIGQNIKKLRELNGLSQKDFAVIAGMSPKTVSAWEVGRIVPRMCAIQRIADYFGVKKSALIETGDFEMYSLIPEDEEKKLLADYRELNLEGRNILRGVLKSLSNTYSTTTVQDYRKT